MVVEFDDDPFDEIVYGGARRDASGVARVSPVRTPKPRRDRKDKGRSRRRAAKIHAYDGPNGSGKSMWMIHDTLPTLDGIPWHCEVADHIHTLNGIYDGERYVLSTVAIQNPETGLPHERYIPLTEWPQLLAAEHCDVLFDEVMGTASSRDHGSLPGEVAELLQKLRHFDIVLRFTSPRFGAAHLDLRSVTQAVTSCRAYFPSMKDRSLVWAPNRIFNARTFPATDYTDGDAPSRSERKKNRGRPVAWMWGPGCRAFAAYDTLGVVTSLRKTTPSGTCSVCGGSRPRPKCKCDDGAVPLDLAHAH